MTNDEVIRVLKNFLDCMPKTYIGWGPDIVKRLSCGNSHYRGKFDRGHNFLLV